MIIGYTTGVFDLFHIGHVNLLKNAKSLCDKLIVGVTIDELVLYKGKRSVIPFHERIQVVQACKYVDVALPQSDMDKLTAVKKYHANILFVGDDWYNTEKWCVYEKELAEIGCKIIYFPYTQGTSSSLINDTLKKLRNNQ
ncbi:adenylyltransferase/cytidyltransferase family protein [Escherichia coli]|nr:adenylyltransferase/cytidyltransferase family protein [Escherichia coli]EJR8404430.1 adenylyltransferase/cytidyltransferase family protein [Escherichia coli]